MEYLRPEQAVGFVRSGDRVYVHGMAAAPSQLLKALANRHKELKDVEIIHLHIEGPAPLVDDNPQVILRDVEYVNNPEVIRQNPKVVAINNAIEVDLTGQVCADSIGPTVYSGVGGQMDFIRGAALSAGGKPVIALPSRTHSGQPRVVSNLRPGAGVVTSRAHVHWVVTEFGRTNLYGKSLRERANALIQLAHPEDREALKRELETRGC